MATLILRPASDSSLRHSCSSGSSGYSLINESQRAELELENCIFLLLLVLYYH